MLIFDVKHNALFGKRQKNVSKFEKRFDNNEGGLEIWKCIKNWILSFFTVVDFNAPM